MATAAAAAAAPLPREKVQDELFYIVSELHKAIAADGRFVFAIKGGAAIALHYLDNGSAIPLPISETPLGLDPAYNVNLPFVNDIDAALYVKSDVVDGTFQTNMQQGCDVLLRTVHAAVQTICGGGNAAKSPTLEIDTDIVSFADYTPTWTTLTLPSTCLYSIRFKGPYALRSAMGIRVIPGSLLTLLYDGKGVFDVQIPNEVKKDTGIAEYTKLNPRLISLQRLDTTIIQVPVGSLEYTIADQKYVIGINTWDARKLKRQKRLEKLQSMVAAAAAAAAAAERRRAAEWAAKPLPPSPPSRALPPPLPPPRQFDALINGKTYVTILDEGGRLYLVGINGVNLRPYTYFFYESPRDITVVYNYGGGVFEESLITGQRWKKSLDRYIPVNSSSPLLSLRARRSTRRARKQRRSSTYRRK